MKSNWVKELKVESHQSTCASQQLFIESQYIKQSVLVHGMLVSTIVYTFCTDIDDLSYMKNHW